MLSSLSQFAKKLWSRLSTAGNQFFRRLTQPGQSNLVTGTLADLPRRRWELIAENALLRQQLIVLHRQVKTPRLTWRERLSLLFLTRWVPNWQQTLQIVRPDTLLRWHREGFRLFSPVLESQIARAKTGEPPGPRRHRADPTSGAGRPVVGCRTNPR